MTHDGPIIIIEDDLDDQELLAATFKVLDYPNQVIYFSDGLKALDFIESDSAYPFLILSDINMPMINGIELRKKIQENEKARIRCIPFLLFTTGAPREAVQSVYSTSVQGFFIKPSSMNKFHNTIRKIMEYWLESYAPFDSPAIPNGYAQNNMINRRSAE